jgi:hypothetical protein
LPALATRRIETQIPAIVMAGLVPDIYVTPAKAGVQFFYCAYRATGFRLAPE